MIAHRQSERTNRVSSFAVGVALFAVLAAAAHATVVAKTWRWYFKEAALVDPNDCKDYSLTNNSGAHAVGMAEYEGSIWTGVIAQESYDDDYMTFVDFDDGVSQGIVVPDDSYTWASGGCVAYGASRKHVLFYNNDYDLGPPEGPRDSIIHCAADVDYDAWNWDYSAELQHHVRQSYGQDDMSHQVVATQHWQDGQQNEHNYVYVAFWDSLSVGGAPEYGMHFRRSTNDGDTWESTTTLLGNNTGYCDLAPTMHS